MGLYYREINLYILYIYIMRFNDPHVCHIGYCCKAFPKWSCWLSSLTRFSYYRKISPAHISWKEFYYKILLCNNKYGKNWPITFLRCGKSSSSSSLLHLNFNTGANFIYDIEKFNFETKHSENNNLMYIVHHNFSDISNLVRKDITVYFLFNGKWRREKC